MKDKRLAKLNFGKLLNYGGDLDVGAEVPTACTGVCVSCSEKGYVSKIGRRQFCHIYHGADTEDFERMICRLPQGGRDVPVVFLLDSPDNTFDSGPLFAYEGFSKSTPLKHHFWARKRANWPGESDSVNLKYALYFADVIATHELKNAYFTFIIKCCLSSNTPSGRSGYHVKADPNHNHSKIRNNCFRHFLEEEMKIMNPRIVFYFGEKATKMGERLRLDFLWRNTHFVRLIHPGFISISHEKLIRLNNALISDALLKVDGRKI